MKEQSHKDEMSAALRGDFERLRERGVALTLTPSDAEPGVERDSEPAPAPAAAPPPAASARDGGLLETPAGDVGEETVSATGARQDALSDVSREGVAAPASRGWLGRLLGR